MSAISKYLSSQYLIENYDVSKDFSYLDRLPYTYVIGWPELAPLDKWYYGVQYGEGVHPSHLMKIYFTSSKHVKKFIEENGLPTVKEIRKIFNTFNKTVDELANEARSWEHAVLRRLNVVQDEKWLNMSDNKCFPILRGEDNGMHGRNHTPETINSMSKLKQGEKCVWYGVTGKDHPMHGYKHSSETIQKMSDDRKGQARKPHTELTKQKIGNANRGENSAWYGKKHTPQELQKMSMANKGEKNYKFTGYYITPYGKYASVIDAPKDFDCHIPHTSIRGWCKNNQKKISKRAIFHSAYLTDDMLDKTFEEIGFSFEKVK